MNTVLINLLDSMNKILAVIIVVGCTAVGYNMEFNGSVVLAVLGAIGGILLAAVICGVLAVILEIERHLRKLAAR